MGLDVGVVKISYLDRPSQPIYDFIWQLAYGAEEGDWGGSWEGNAFVEVQRRRTLSKARAYVRKQGLSER